MPPIQAPVPVPLDDATPARLLTYGPTTTSSVSTFVRNTSSGQAWVVTGIDFTATQANPVQCFFAAELWLNTNTFGPTFYYDSQSTGEGNGVWFSWRGAVSLNPTDALAIVATSVSNIVWGGHISGLVLPRG